MTVRDEPSQIAGSTLALNSKLFRFLSEIYTNSDRDCHVENRSIIATTALSIVPRGVAPTARNPELFIIGKRGL